MATLTTPKYGLPYPDGAERVMDGDNAIGALANAIDALLATLAPSPILGRATGSLVLGTTAAPIPGAVVTWTAPAAETCIAFATFDVNVTVGPVFGIGSLWLDGVGPRTSQANLNTPGVLRANVAQYWHLGLGPGSHTVQLYGAKVGAGGTASIEATHTLLELVRFRTSPALRELLDELDIPEITPA